VAINYVPKLGLFGVFYQLLSIYLFFFLLVYVLKSVHVFFLTALPTAAVYVCEPLHSRQDRIHILRNNLRQNLHTSLSSNFEDAGIANSSLVATIPRTPLASKITFLRPTASTHPLHKNTQSTCYPCPTPSLSCSWLAIRLDGFAQLNIHAGHRNTGTENARKTQAQ
jgi:hypothetical protein